MESFRWIWSYVNKYKFKFCFALIMVLVAAAMTMVNPYFSGKIVDEVIGEGKTNMLVPIIGIMIGVMLIKSIIRYTFQMLFEYVSQDAIYKLRDDLYIKLQSLDFEYFKQHRTGDIMARMTGDMDALRHFVAWVIYNIFENAMIFIFAVVMMGIINIKLTVALIIVTPVIGIIAYNMTSKVRPMFYHIRESFSRLNSFVEENISGNRVVKAFAKEGYEIEKFDKHNQDYMDKNIESAKLWEKYLPVLDFFAGSLSIIMMLVGGIMVINKSMTIGELVVFNGYLWALNNPMRMVGPLINDYQRFVASSYKIREMLSEEPNIKSEDEKDEIQEIKGQVDFKDVCFEYEDGPVLKNINFTAKPGQTVAILGPTGAGKSTLVNLICRFYDATSGNILIDKKDIKKWNLKSLRDNIAMSMQDVFLFSDTIEGNIAFGDPYVSFETIEKVSAMAGAHGFISQMPEGYDTIVGERGVGLSGGQKQRISLARALLKNPSILILDDTTSAVDMETEYEIQKQLDKVNKEKTTFIIAHRISSVKNADIILVLDNGKIVERGNHDELLRQKGYYHSVYVNQFGDFDKVKEVG
ncbi:ABC transporter ATP-binding protein [Clostridium cellulovorans]|uniref:ABC transporter transmembrane region n=1 Tax=Clostridium cellulovorans (strain ATCC 35296 / DSM 3052 / OCM 3 / 743B) TaxID=573061 RepID=D9SL00_CLOC7|nr:ABC transporter ATP-binding protein [Clostridium cellulovorans]ADL53572.1 ABC transporter transmembrane region [Clostridium cellulovorans 743B]